MTQRSHQEVEAEREAKAKAIKEQIQKLEMVKRLLAEANTLEDIEDDARIHSVSPLSSRSASVSMLLVIAMMESFSTSRMSMRWRQPKMRSL